MHKKPCDFSKSLVSHIRMVTFNSKNRLWRLMRYYEWSELKRWFCSDRILSKHVYFEKPWHHACQVHATWHTYNSHGIPGTFLRIWKHQSVDFSHHSWCIKGKSTINFLHHFQRFQNLLSEKSSSLSILFIIFSNCFNGCFIWNSFCCWKNTSTIMLNIKENQNPTLDFDSSKYAYSLKPMIECLHYSPLAQSLTVVECVPLVHLCMEFSSANYNPNEGVITFEVDSNKTSISKARFCRMLGFSSSGGLVDPVSISSFTILEMFYQI